MGWVLKTLELPPEEDAIAKEWMDTPRIREFLKWLTLMVADAPNRPEVRLDVRVIGKVLAFIGQSLIEIAQEDGETGESGWDGTPPQAPTNGA